MFIAGIVIFIMGGILLSIGMKMKPDVKPRHMSSEFSQDFINQLFSYGFINEHQKLEFMNMQTNEQQLFLQQQIAQLDAQQSQFFMENMNMEQQNMFHMMETGIEFGGMNTDLNLNPMQHDIINQQMNDINNNNNFGGPGMF